MSSVWTSCSVGLEEFDMVVPRSHSAGWEWSAFWQHGLTVLSSLQMRRRERYRALRISESVAILAASTTPWWEVSYFGKCMRRLLLHCCTQLCSAKLMRMLWPGPINNKAMIVSYSRTSMKRSCPLVYHFCVLESPREGWIGWSNDSRMVKKWPPINSPGMLWTISHRYNASKGSRAASLWAISE